MKSVGIAILLSTTSAFAQQFRPERFAPIPPAWNAWPVQELAAGDLDGDGFDDVVAALDHGGVAHLRADRNGGFVDVTTSVLQPPFAAAYGVALGDADADGDLDLVAVHDHSGVVQVCMNQGNGTFVDVTATFSTVTALFPSAVTWIDIDGDRLLDVFVVDYYGNRLLHQRSGRLVDVSATHLPAGLPSLVAQRVEPFDVDADGDQDLLLYQGVFAPFLLNDGTGRLAAPPAGMIPIAFARLIGCGDFDRNGLADLVVLSNGSTLTFLLQTVRGTFVDATATHFAGIVMRYRAVATDVDLDGDLDLCTPAGLLVNDGAGRFSDASSTRWTTTTPQSGFFTGPRYTTGDFDGDGDPDFVVVDALTRQLVSVNHHRQVSAPLQPIRGGSYPLVFEAEPGYASGTTLALPWFALGPTSRFVPPFGHLGVDPATTIAGPTLQLAAPTGRSSLALTVPNSPALSGATLYVQALLAGPSGSYRLTNTVRDTVR